jgi:hypothetical protein
VEDELGGTGFDMGLVPVGLTMADTVLDLDRKTMR